MTTCVVERLTCDNKHRLKELENLAEEQYTNDKTEFIEFYPWRYAACEDDPNIIQYVAVAKDIICGWAIVGIKTYHGYKTLEIGTISTRQKRMGDQRIGRLIIEKIKEDIGDFAFLHADNDFAFETYRKWGFLPMLTKDEISLHDEKFHTNLSHLMMFPKKDISQKFKEMMVNDMKMLTEKGYYTMNRTGGTRKSKRKTLRKKH